MPGRTGKMGVVGGVGENSRVADARGHKLPGFIPPQHGAWAFLVVPLLVGWAVAEVAPGRGRWGCLFAVAWIGAYPVSFFAGRALSLRSRRGSWTRLARRELSRALPWCVLLAAAGAPLAVGSPWLLAVAFGLGAAWLTSLALAARIGERSLGNDAALLAQALAAVPLMAALLAGPELSTATAVWGQPDLWLATAAVGTYLFGTVLHVKTLLRRAGDPGFRRLSVGYHAVAAALSAVVSPWWLLGFGPALLRAALVRPGLRPPVIGAYEAIGSTLFVIAAFVAA